MAGNGDTSEVWRRVMRHMPQLRRIAKAMSSCDDRLSADDILNDAVVDIVEAEPRLFDPARGTWLAWARTRVWKTRTYALRRANLHQSRDQVPVGRPRDESDPSIEPAAGVGSIGHAGRMEASITLQEVLERATEDELDAAIAHLSGFGVDKVARDPARNKADDAYRSECGRRDAAARRRQGEVADLLADLGTRTTGYGVR